MNLQQEIRARQGEIVKTLSELIRIPSVRGEPTEGCPYGAHSAEALRWVLELCAGMGFRTKNLGNRVGYAEFGEGEELVGILIHLDVVPVGGVWERDPFSGDVADGRVYGRGAEDDKGPGVAALYCAKTLMDLGVEPKRRVRLIFGTNEETSMDDMDYYVEREGVPDYAFAPDGLYPIINCEKGMAKIAFAREGGSPGAVVAFEGGTAVNIVPESARAILDGSRIDAAAVAQAARSYQGAAALEAETGADGRLTVTARGRAAHAAYAPDGVNAIGALALFLREQLKEQAGPLVSFLAACFGMQTDGAAARVRCEDEVSGPLTLNVGLAQAGETGQSAHIDIRYPVSRTAKELADTLAPLAARWGFSTAVTHDMPPLLVPEDSRIVRELSAVYEQVTGRPAFCRPRGVGTYCRKMAGRAVTFGAHLEDTPHTNYHEPNEFIEIENLMGHAEICIEAIYRLATMPAV